MNTPDIRWNARREHWFFVLDGRTYNGWPNKTEAAKAYVVRLLEKYPKYRPLFTGKSWAQIFAMTKITITGAEYERKPTP